MAEVSIFDPAMLVWVDETGFRCRNSIRAYGYSLRGMHPTDHQLRVGQKTSMQFELCHLRGLRMSTFQRRMLMVMFLKTL